MDGGSDMGGGKGGKRKGGAGEGGWGGEHSVMGEGRDSVPYTALGALRWCGDRLVMKRAQQAR